MTLQTKLAELRAVGRDAWLEAGGCDKCWGTHLVVDRGRVRPFDVLFTLENVDYILRAGSRCACTSRVGICPDLPAEFHAAVDVTLERMCVGGWHLPNGTSLNLDEVRELAREP